MIYLKSTLVGIVGGLLGYGLRLMVYFYLNHPPYHHIRIVSPPAVIMTVLGFTAGYCWMYFRTEGGGPTNKKRDLHISSSLEERA